MNAQGRCRVHSATFLWCGSYAAVAMILPSCSSAHLLKAVTFMFWSEHPSLCCTDWITVKGYIGLWGFLYAKENLTFRGFKMHWRWSSFDSSANLWHELCSMVYAYPLFLCVSFISFSHVVWISVLIRQNVIRFYINQIKFMCMLQTAFTL